MLEDGVDERRFDSKVVEVRTVGPRTGTPDPPALRVVEVRGRLVESTSLDDEMLERRAPFKDELEVFRGDDDISWKVVFDAGPGEVEGSERKGNWKKWMSLSSSWKAGGSTRVRREARSQDQPGHIGTGICYLSELVVLSLASNDVIGEEIRSNDLEEGREKVSSPEVCDIQTFLRSFGDRRKNNWRRRSSWKLE